MRTYIEDTIKHDFVELIKTEKINTITVDQILAPSGINRKTFYKHFSSISDLICSILKDNYIKKLEMPSDPLEWKEYACHIMTKIKDNASIIERLFQSKYSAEIRLFFHKELNIVIKNFIQGMQKKYEKQLGRPLPLSARQEDYMVKLYTPFIYSWIEEWLVTGMKEDIPEYLEAVDKIIYGGIFECISYFSEKT